MHTWWYHINVMVEPKWRYHPSFPLYPCHDTSRFPLFSGASFSISSHMLVSEPRKPPSQTSIPALVPFSVTPLVPMTDLQTNFSHPSSPLNEPFINGLFGLSLTSCLGLWWPSQAWSSYGIALNSTLFTLPSSPTKKWCHLPYSYLVELIGSMPPALTGPCCIQATS